MTERVTEKQDETPVRSVQDAQGRTWFAYPVIEGSKLGAPRRASWLCLECGPDRRYISPVPEDWQKWSDATLLHSISSARPDLRD
ncbi:MAG: hypothetical protein JWN79_2551 [Gemmatimonadetes bacterium]|jgi:hypothetical protein|nr:hypothetical protein [Gemmatimonadota bacterium]